MADVEELQRQLQQLRAAGRIRDDALRYLGKTEDLQRERWDLLRRVIEDAGKQYAAMRHDVVEEGQRDQGAPLWLSCLLAVAVTFIPVTSMTSAFVFALTTSAQKQLTRAFHEEMRSASRALFGGERDYAKMFSASDKWLHLPKEIKRTEEMVAKVARSLEPEVANTLQDAARGALQYLSKPPFKQESGRKMVQPNAPIVVVTQALHRWVDSLVRVERLARHELEEKIQDLFDIATSPSPGEEAKATEAIAKMRGREYEKPLPKTNKAALDQLTELRRGLAPVRDEATGAVKIEDLRELQLMIESMIWATTYDFTPRAEYYMDVTDPTRQTTLQQARYTLGPAPLPEGLWKRLIERYIDRDAGKSYKDVGSLDRLGTVKLPSYEAGNPTTGKKWSPEVRLSHYFSQILYRQINEENSEMVQRFRHLSKAPP
jgi:hypothetical protein